MKKCLKIWQSFLMMRSMSVSRQLRIYHQMMMSWNCDRMGQPRWKVWVVPRVCEGTCQWSICSWPFTPCSERVTFKMEVPKKNPKKISRRLNQSKLSIMLLKVNGISVLIVGKGKFSLSNIKVIRSVFNNMLRMWIIILRIFFVYKIFSTGLFLDNIWYPFILCCAYFILLRIVMGQDHYDVIISK